MRVFFHTYKLVVKLLSHLNISIWSEMCSAQFGIWKVNFNVLTTKACRLAQGSYFAQGYVMLKRKGVRGHRNETFDMKLNSEEFTNGMNNEYIQNYLQQQTPHPRKVSWLLFSDATGNCKVGRRENMSRHTGLHQLYQFQNVTPPLTHTNTSQMSIANL